MKEKLKDLIKKTILLEYKLPHAKIGINKSCITHQSKTDDCYKVEKLDNFARIIYESILYYSYDEYQLDGGNHQKMFLNAFNHKFKYNYDAAELSKLRLGIYGESLLYAILKIFYGNKTLISRGYFYDLQKKSEVTGYDCFHLIENEHGVELWFGETKFHKSISGALKSVFEDKNNNIKINEVISDEYLINTNLVTIMQHHGNIVDKTTKIYSILEKWEKGLIENLQQELIDYKIKLVYPILIAFDQGENYIDSIKKAIDHINTKYSHVKFDKISIDYSIFFILIPISSSETCKKTIISWIDSQEPLM